MSACTSYLIFTHEVSVVLVMLQRVVEGEPLGLLLVHRVFLDTRARRYKSVLSGHTIHSVEPSSGHALNVHHRPVFF